MAKLAGIALFAGLGASVALFYISYATHWVLLFWLQIAGFGTTILMRGMEGALKSDYAEIGIPVNAAVYAILIFLLLRKFRKAGST